MSGTSEERLARLEVLVSELRDDIKEERAKNNTALGELRADMRELLAAAHMGKGAGWIVIRFGAVCVGAIGVAKILIDLWPHK
jgi:hypothetical protein